jgi:hypothetical protein
MGDRQQHLILGQIEMVLEGVDEYGLRNVRGKPGAGARWA